VLRTTCNRKLTPVLDEETGYAQARSAYDEQGRIASVRYYDEKGKACTAVSGCAGVDYAYGDGEVSETSVDEQGNPTLNAQGYAVCRYRTDEAGQPLERTYYDAAGENVTIL